MNIQLGKQGITENFLMTLNNHFKKHKNVRISVLPSARKDKKSVKDYSEKILKSLGNNYNSKVIGFTIILRKYGKAVR